MGPCHCAAVAVHMPPPPPSPPPQKKGGPGGRGHLEAGVRRGVLFGGGGGQSMQTLGPLDQSPGGQDCQSSCTAQTCSLVSFFFSSI